MDEKGFCSQSENHFLYIPAGENWFDRLKNVSFPIGLMWQMANEDRKAHPKTGTEREEPVSAGGPALDLVEDDSTQTLT